MTSDFAPFDATTEDIEARQVLRDGVPATMRSSLVAWIGDRVVDRRGWGQVRVLQDIENNCDITLNLGASTIQAGNTTRDSLHSLGDRDLLLTTHYLLSRQVFGNAGHADLEKVLTDGRSRWTIGKTSNDKWGLIARVPQGVQEAAETLIAQGGSAGQLLANAWAYVHDLNPDDSVAYWNAVKAVEAAALPALGITKPSATLNNVILTIERKDAAWRLPFLREHTEYPSKTVLLGMLKSLYRGQRDRHGSEAYSDVTHDEAIAAVLISVTLVGLFAGGLVMERDSETFV